MSLQRSSDHLWNWWHKLLHFAKLDRILHDARQLSHDFGHLSVLLMAIHIEPIGKQDGHEQSSSENELDNTEGSEYNMDHTPT